MGRAHATRGESWSRRKRTARDQTRAAPLCSRAPAIRHHRAAQAGISGAALRLAAGTLARLGRGLAVRARRLACPHVRWSRTAPPLRARLSGHRPCARPPPPVESACARIVDAGVAPHMTHLLAISWAMPPMLAPRSLQVSRLLKSLTQFGYAATVITADLAAPILGLSSDPRLAEFYAGAYARVLVT